MNRHQVLTGAANSTNDSFAVGSVQGVPFSAYAAGCDIVILAGDFQRVQIIPGITKGNVQVGCVDCSVDTGKIAASYGSEVYIYEPTPLIHQVSTHKLDYHWIQTAAVSTDSFVNNISWNLEGNRLLTGGQGIQLWQFTMDSPDDMTIPEEEVSFQVGIDDKLKCENQWFCIWQCKTAHSVYFLKFSPDGNLFASAGKSDRLIKVWHEDRNVNLSYSMDKSNSQMVCDISYKFIYLAHPRAVTGLSWRQTSKYMPKGAVANMLVTSCKDNICRIWVQTILPDDGLINLNQFEPIISQNPKLRAQKHKQKIMQRLKHMKSFFNFRSRHPNQFTEDAQETIPSLPSTFSVHDFHSFGMYAGGITPGFHFHLSASINAETDIPLVPSLNCVSNEPNFILHWLNNKELEFTLSAEKLLEHISKKALIMDPNLVEERITSNTSEDDMCMKGKKRGSNSKSPLTRSKSADVSSPSPASVSSNTSSSTSIATDASSHTQQSMLGDFLDHKIEKLVTEWSQSPDLLFSIHPVDGSFLVWLVEWLDEYSPGLFRQAQVSFSSRIPNALPLGDAMTMNNKITLYNPLCFLDLKTVLGLSSETKQDSTNKQTATKTINNPTVCMISKHSNGTLNLWHITFNENSKYTQVLSIGHSCRMCGHRFRVNEITCHPVLPLLLTTSHHNSPQCNHCVDSGLAFPETGFGTGFCSELILWKVDPVGPLSQSGGVTELARINSPLVSAFSNIAWIPTLLPSTTLGSVSNSPSACFVASDGFCLRVYQAVIDARTLLAEISNAERKDRHSTMSFSSSSSSNLNNGHVGVKECFNVVSQQSTSRPGCILQLDSIANATHDWQNTQLLHVFQEQLITGESKQLDVHPTLFGPQHQAIIDLHNTTVFEHPFYLVVLEKNVDKSVLHMWKVVISSQPENRDLADSGDYSYVPDSNLVQDSDHSNVSSRGSTPEPISPTGLPNNTQFSPVSLTTNKLCSRVLPLPEDVEIVHATPAAGHLSSSSIYPACFAPYLISTACSDGFVRFWKCIANDDGSQQDVFKWIEWEMMTSKDGESCVDIPGQPLNVSCAYSGRIACAYKYGRSFTRSSSINPNERFVNLCVAIYECESTGGSEWILEDVIHLKNISLNEQNIDLSLYETEQEKLKRERKAFDQIARNISPTSSYPNGEFPTLVSVPSFSTLQTLRKNITEQGNCSLLTQKHLVQLDWVSTEDGSHILTIGVGAKIMMFTPVSSDIAQANIKAMETSKSVTRRPVLRKASSMAVPQYQAEDIRWMKLRSIDLTSADGLPPLPMQLSWVRDGILVVGMDNEMQIFSQWKTPNQSVVVNAGVEITKKVENSD
ncbi:DMXL1 (predicted), partial [Pycnogonum litorale]